MAIRLPQPPRTNSAVKCEVHSLISVIRVEGELAFFFCCSPFFIGQVVQVDGMLGQLLSARLLVTLVA